MTRGTWQRITRRTPCPICGRPDWCLLSDDGTAVICARTQSEKPVGAQGAGWLHRLNGSGDWPQRPRVRRLRVPLRGQSVRDFDQLAERYAAAVEPGALMRFADGLGVSHASLKRLHVGWDGEAWTFPMFDATRAVIGIRRRLPNGRKLSVTGGREALFIPYDLSESGDLLICEGPTDTAALLDFDFLAVGRPSCTGGMQWVVALARGRDAVIMADADTPGQRGAARLASVLATYCPSVRIVAPPDGMKDVRDWVRRGATRDKVLRTIETTPPMRLTVRVVRT